MPITAKEKREQLIREGYCIFENVLEPEMVAKLNAMSEWTIAQEDPAHFDQHRSQGCIIPYWRYPHPAYAELIVYPLAMAVLAELGFDRPKVWSGFVISKPPHAPPLFWHQDGVLWDHPISYTDQPQQYFLMYYLVDTNRGNGCLRVVPGTHLKRHALHDVRPSGDDGVTRASNLDHAAFQHAEGEIDVPVKAGDVVIGDSRLMHSAHANESDQRRTVLTIWYWPSYDELPEDVKQLISDHITEREDWCRWVEQTRHVTGELIPLYDGEVEHLPWTTLPDQRLQ
ncbi:MAG: phytanoyl-CoA dioxygenase family protein [Candidatus Poribacteria bacterium]|nr:phytanoyl-CoA dioxygenase family protein [Candidatus Poribacteria bacterium]